MEGAFAAGLILCAGIMNDALIGRVSRRGRICVSEEKRVDRGRKIGFGHGAPQNPQTIWEKKLGDAIVIYTKICVEGGFFIYDCNCRRGSITTATSWQTSSDMPPNEVELIPRFVDFLAGKIS